MVDLLILAVLAFGIVHGIRTGFIKQVASIVGMVLAFLLASQHMQWLGEQVVQSIGASENLAPLFGFVLIFLFVYLLVVGAMRLVEKAMRELKLSIVNRSVGGAVGAFKAGFALSVAFLVLSYFSFPSAQAKAESQFYEPVTMVLPSSWDYIHPYIPQLQDLAERIGSSVTLPTDTPARPASDEPSASDG